MQFTYPDRQFEQVDNMSRQEYVMCKLVNGLDLQVDSLDIRTDCLFIQTYSLGGHTDY